MNANIENFNKKIDTLFDMYNIEIRRHNNNFSRYTIDFFRLVYGYKIETADDIREVLKEELNFKIAEELLYINWTDQERNVVRQLQKFLGKYGIMNDCYSIGCRREKVFSIIKKDNEWIVSYLNNNTKIREKIFYNVYDASIYLVERFGKKISTNNRKPFYYMLKSEMRQIENNKKKSLALEVRKQYYKESLKNSIYMYSNSIEFKKKLKK